MGEMGERHGRETLGVARRVLVFATLVVAVVPQANNDSDHVMVAVESAVRKSFRAEAEGRLVRQPI